MSRYGHGSTSRSSVKSASHVSHASASAALLNIHSADLNGEHLHDKDRRQHLNDTMPRSSRAATANISNQESNSSSSQASSQGDGEEEADSGGDDDDDDEDEEAEYIAPSSDPTIKSKGIKNIKTSIQPSGTTPAVSRTGLKESKENLQETKGVKAPGQKPYGVSQTKKQGDEYRDTAGRDRHHSKIFLLEQDITGENLDAFSDDDDYAAVDLVSDSEGDEPDVERLEERMIINEEEGYFCEEKANFSSVFSSSADVMQGLLFENVSQYDFNIIHDQPATDLGLPTTTYKKPQDCQQRQSSSRRVRFEDEITASGRSSSGDSDLRSDLFPDIYVQSSSLGLEWEKFDEPGSHDSSESDSGSSYWDLKAVDPRQLDCDGLDVDTASDDSSGSSNHCESENGDTTDDDVPVPATISRPSTLLTRQLSSSTVEQRAKERESQQLPVPSSRKKGPVMGSWAVDRSESVAVFDNRGKRMVFIRPRTPGRTVQSGLWKNGSISSNSSISQSSPRTALCNLGRTDSELTQASQTVVDPMDVMTSGVFRTASGNELFIGSNLFGATQAFYPFEHTGSGNAMHLQDEDAEEDEDSDGEGNLNIEDFIDFGDNTSESEDECEDREHVPVVGFSRQSAIASGGPKPSLVTGSPRDAKMPNMLSHLGRGNVTAFRRHQNNYRRASALPENPAMRASIMEINALQAGSGIAANSPITPPRKRKLGKDAARVDGPYSGVVSRDLQRRKVRRIHQP